MIAPQTFNNYPEFGSAATKCCPDTTKYANGYIQGDVLPAEHLNWFLSGATLGVSTLQLGMDSIEKEMQTLLCCSGKSPSSSCYSQVYDSIRYQIESVTNTLAPKAHASSATTYGVGNADCFGHLKISDSYTSVLAACSGVAASQQALAIVYGVANSKAALGSTAGCALGTASAGTATTAARSDHVHPMPTEIACATKIERYAFTGNYVMNIALLDGCSCASGSTLYASCDCLLQYNPAEGILYANQFCGTASFATNAACAGTATCAVNASAATLATSATTINRNSYSQDHTFEVALFDGTSCDLEAPAYVSANARLTFNTGAGILYANCFCGVATCANAATSAGTATCASNATTAFQSTALGRFIVGTASTDQVYRNGTTLINNSDRFILFFNADPDLDQTVRVASTGLKYNYLAANQNYSYVLLS